MEKKRSLSLTPAERESLRQATRLQELRTVESNIMTTAEELIDYLGKDWKFDPFVFTLKKHLKKRKDIIKKICLYTQKN